MGITGTMYHRRILFGRSFICICTWVYVKSQCGTEVGWHLACKRLDQADTGIAGQLLARMISSGKSQSSGFMPLRSCPSCSTFICLFPKSLSSAHAARLRWLDSYGLPHFLYSFEATRSYLRDRWGIDVSHLMLQVSVVIVLLGCDAIRLTRFFNLHLT